MSDEELAPIRTGEELDWPKLEAALRAELGDQIQDAPLTVQQFPRGSANLTYLLRFGALELVLRRPPFGKVAPGAHDMAREHRVLSKLWRAFDRAPRAYFFSDDPAIIGAPFVVQEYRSGGVAIFEQPPASMAALPDLGMRLTVAMADALADMHKVDWQAAGLSDLGKPEGFIERNMQNWRDRWRRASESNPVPLMESLGERLEKEMPKTQRFSIIHNDFKLNNCQFLGSNPDRVHSIFDWDMATVGDPFFDVGIALNYWASQTMSGKFTLPPKEVFAELYAARMNLYPSALRWYEAFGAWRSAITVQQLYNRYAQGQSSDERLKNLAGSVPRMAEAAAQIWRGA